MDQAYDAARRVGITILSVIKNDIGFEKVNKIVKILGLVNCSSDFLSQPKVINGCSDLFVEFFGKEKGMHARSAMGVYVLPNNIPVEIEAIIELNSQAT
jgi:enamine deaminase RidA (YjgF/YER057c/UK114 family)